MSNLAKLAAQRDPEFCVTSTSGDSATLPTLVINLLAVPQFACCVQTFMIDDSVYLERLATRATWQLRVAKSQPTLAIAAQVSALASSGGSGRAARGRGTGGRGQTMVQASGQIISTFRQRGHLGAPCQQETPGRPSPRNGQIVVKRACRGCPADRSF